MKKTKSKSLLTNNDVENLKETCRTHDGRSVIRDLTDTGLSLKEVLKKRANNEVLR